MRSRLPLASAILILAAACATDAPRREPADVVALPSRFDAASETAIPAPIPSWGTLFDDPRLDDLVAEALESNRNIVAAAARVERAAAQARIVGADLYPQANASFDGSRRRQNFIGLPIPGSDGVLSNTSTSFGTGLNVSWEADIWGRLRSARNAAEADAGAIGAQYDAARLSIAAQVAKTWLSLIEAKEQLELAAATHANRVTNAERVRRRYEAGLGSAVDLRLAESNAALAESRLELRRRQVDSAARQLEVLLGRYPAAAAEVPGRLPAIVAPLPAGIPASVMARRPDVRAAERRAAAASARIAQARAALYPQLRLTGSSGTSSNELRDLLDGDFSVWSLVSNIVQPIFQGGRLRANVDASVATETEAVALFAQSVLDALAEVETSLFAQEVLARQEEALRLAAENAIEAQSTAEQRYAAGLIDYLVLLETQRQAFEAQSQLLDARRQRLTARVDLHLVLGGDADTRIEEEVR